MTDTRQPELSLDRFERLVESYGGDIDRFPPHERAGARALVVRSRDARRMLDAARALDAVLASARDGLPSVSFEQALLAIPNLHGQERVENVFPLRSKRVAMFAAAAALALGVLSGTTLPSEEEEVASAEQDDVMELALGDELLFSMLTNDVQEGGESP